MPVRKAIEVSGIVQGVGFRPYIYRLASERQLVGSICNTAAGVSIEVQGPPAAVDDFLARLPAEAPPLARIPAITVREVALQWRPRFPDRYHPSRRAGKHAHLPGRRGLRRLLARDV